MRATEGTGMIVDGGLGVELGERGLRFTTKLWSAEAILRAPEMLVAAHRAFLEAGARMLATATYQLSHAGLRELGYTEPAIEATFARGVALAREAVAAHRRATGTAEPIAVAASLGPFGATLGDGSEYSGVAQLEPAALYAFHAERAAAVARARPDIVLFETIPSLREARIIAAVARDLDLPRVWISLTCPDATQTYAGDTIASAGRELAAFAGVEAIGVNCVAPAIAGPLLRALRGATAKPLVVCPNLGQHWEDATHGLTGGDSEAAFLRYVPDWLAAGATHLGGCCGVGPRTLAALAAAAQR